MTFNTYQRKERLYLLMFIDLILVNLATFFSLWIQAARLSNTLVFEIIIENISWFVFLSALWLISATLNGFYQSQKIFNMISAIPALVGTTGLALLVYFGVFFFAIPQNILPRGIVLYQGVISLFLIGFWRFMFSLLAHKPGFGRKVIIVGAGWAGETIAQAINQFARHEYHIVGFVDDNEDLVNSNIVVEMNVDEKTSSSVHIPVLGTTVDLTELICEHKVPEIVLAVTHHISTATFQTLLDCKEQGVQITIMPVLYEQLTGRVPIEHIGDNWNVALPLDSAESSGIYPIANRIFDIISSLFGLFLLLPFSPFLALAIYVDSPGPIFYKQERVGKGGKPFYLYKLRTMIPDAEKSGAERAKAGDVRITRIGKYLRKMRLDEMPQLINILKGEMSAVGPRPERPEHLEELNEIIPFHRLRNAVKPGMAGWAVVNYGYIESLDDAKIRLQYDLYYVKHQSLWLDIIILLQTAWQAVTLKGR